jgi:hypothetical protein
MSPEDDFAEEIEAVRRNEAHMHLLEKRSKETERFNLQQVREALGTKKARPGKGSRTKKSPPRS